MTITEIDPTTGISDYAVMRTMREVVDDAGADYIYNKENPDTRCVYRKDGEPSCLVGHVLHHLTPDFEPREVGAWSQRQALQDRGYSRRAVYALQMAQVVQDRRYPWGAALAAAEAIMEFSPENW